MTQRKSRRSKPLRATPSEPNTDIGRAKPFWEEVPDKKPPPYKEPENPYHPDPFWSRPPREPRKGSRWVLVIILILLGLTSLWL